MNFIFSNISEKISYRHPVGASEGCLHERDPESCEAPLHFTTGSPICIRLYTSFVGDDRKGN
ncbi:MAG: hypothetical protein AUJ12_10060 [Alphaproteobacteria bacterium CG1_02_46_17]|nr:MAG: hypothetical protein AUJ12_10060 [Alphaproteobacteria bacterium CG1_02_46_17]